MAAETLTGYRALSTFPRQSAGYATNTASVWGYYDIAANVEDGDIFELVRTPRMFLCLGGWVAMADIDTGTEALDMDIGWAANGTSSAGTHVTPWGETLTDAGYSASADGLVNSGVWSGDGVTDLFAAGQNYRPIILPTPKFFMAPTMIQAEANAAAGTFTAGRLNVVLQGVILG
jgi:hypothetical protein